MNNNDEQLPKGENNGNNDAPVMPDPETLHTTDPQENMEGPVSSLMQAGKETVEEASKETGKEGESKN